MRGSGKTVRSGSWENVPLSQIVTEVAKRNGWEPVCPVTTKVERIDQRNESDFNFITRLARQYDSTAKVAEGKLLVMPRQAGRSTSGKSLLVVTINKTDVARYQFRLGDRSTQKAVKTQHQDQKTGALKVVELANDDSPDGLPPVHTDRHIYPNKTAAEQAAKARLAAFNRSTAAVRLEMVGRTDLFAERTINAQGFKNGLDGEYLVDSVEQVFTASGWTTTVECNGGKKGKATAKGKKKKETKPLRTVDVSPA
ncbi:phage late control protein GPD [compost metagenome]